MPAPDTWEAIKKAATTAGTLISLRNWSTESMFNVPQKIRPTPPDAPTPDETQNRTAITGWSRLVRI